MSLNASMSWLRSLSVGLSVALAALMLATSVAHGATDSAEAQPSVVPAGWTWEAGPGTWVFEVRSPALELANDRVQKGAAATLGRPVAVYCATSDTHWPAILTSVPGLSSRAIAFAWFDRGPVVLSAGVCRQLERVAKHRRGRWARTRTVAVLAHELGHVAGYVDEHAADCWSAGRSKRLARALGLERPMAVRRDVTRFLGLAGTNGCREYLLAKRA